MDLPLPPEAVQLPLQPVKRVVLAPLKGRRLEQFLEEGKEAPPERELLPTWLPKRLEEVDQLHPWLLVSTEQTHVEVVDKLV